MRRVIGYVLYRLLAVPKPVAVRIVEVPDDLGYWVAKREAGVTPDYVPDDIHDLPLIPISAGAFNRPGGEV